MATGFEVSRAGIPRLKWLLQTTAAYSRKGLDVQKTRQQEKKEALKRIIVTHGVMIHVTAGVNRESLVVGGKRKKN